LFLLKVCLRNEGNCAMDLSAISSIITITKSLKKVLGGSSWENYAKELKEISNVAYEEFIELPSNKAYYDILSSHSKEVQKNMARCVSGQLELNIDRILPRTVDVPDGIKANLMETICSALEKKSLEYFSRSKLTSIDAKGDIQSAKLDLILEELKRIHNSNKSDEKTIFPSMTRYVPVNNLPDPNQHFYDREGLIESIEVAFQKCNKLTITAPGGYGKSQLAFRYADKHISEYRYIWVVNAQSEEELDADYREFAIRTGISKDYENSFMEIRRYTINWLENNERYLFIYENAEGLSDKLSDFLPRGRYLRGHILITSQYKDKISEQHIEIDLFSESDAIKFLQSRVPSTEDDARKLVNMLGRLPLALEHAIAYMDYCKLSCAQYIDLLPNDMLDILGADLDKFKRTIATTWQLSIEKIESESESAIQLFNLCAYLAPDQIPHSMLVNGREHLPSPLCSELESDSAHKQVELLHRLKRFSLISFSRDSSGGFIISIHRLIQMVVRNKASKDIVWITHCLNMADKVFGYSFGNKEKNSAFEQNAPHIIKMLHYAEEMLLDNESKNKMHSLYSRLGGGFYYNGKHQEGIDYWKKALNICEEVNTRVHSNSATIINNIGVAYRNIGNDTEALKWHLEALEIRESLDENDDLAIALIKCNIGTVYRNLGMYLEALAQFNEAIDIQNKYEKEHPRNATTWHFMGSTHSLIGDYEDALKWLYKALEVREKDPGKEHPHTASTYDEIGLVYYRQEKLDCALEWLCEALKIRKKVSGKAHFDTASSYKNIGDVYNTEGDYLKAVKLYKEALTIRRKVFGEDHKFTKSVFDILEMTYKNLCLDTPLAEWLDGCDYDVMKG